MSEDFRHPSSWGAILLLTIISCGFSDNSAGAQEASRLSVESSGTAVRVPDRAWIRFTVSIEAKTTAEAVDANAVTVKGLLDQLHAKGITSKNLQTAALSLQPKYEVRQEGMREIRGDLIGTIASKSVVAIIEDVTLVASYIREFPLAGTIRIADTGFFSTDAEGAQAEALVHAIQRAQQAAQTATAAAARQLGPVSSMEISIQSELKGPPQVNEPLYAYQQQQGVIGARLLAEAGEQRYNQSVRLQWQLR